MSTCRDALAPEVSSLLQGQDWEAICKEMTAFAIYWARNYRWRNGGHWDLALGRTIEDIVQDVIVKTIEGRRKWDPQRGPLAPWLRDQVKSEIDHLCHSAAHRYEKLNPADTDKESGSSIEGHTSQQRSMPANRQPENPETTILRNEDIEQREKALFQAANGDPELEELVNAVSHGCTPKPRHLADKLGVPVKDINNRLKRLRRRAMKLMEEDEP